MTPSLDPSRSLQRTAAAALGALVLYLPALTLPLIEIERLGHRRISSLAGGTYELLLHGDVWVGLVILAVGAGEQRPWVIDGALGVATVMSATGSFDHRAIDGADGAALMQAFQQLVENPMGLVV